MFKILKDKVNARFLQMQALGLFVVSYDRDLIWQTYLENFPEAERQEHTCNACKQFIRQAGAAVTIDPVTLEIGTVWDIDGVPEEYAASVAALAAYVRGLPIAGLFWHTEGAAGVDQNIDRVRTEASGTPNIPVVWQHFHVKIPTACRDNGGDKLRASAKLREGKEMFKRAMDQLRLEDVDLVLELIGQNSLYGGTQKKYILDAARVLMAKYADVPAEKRELYCWNAVKNDVSEGMARFRNDVIGTLLIDLAEGKPLELAVKAFEDKTSGTNYQRPTALATPKMIEAAKQRLVELDLMSALHRRRLDPRDLTVAHALHVHRPQQKAAGDVFAEIAGEAVVDTKTLSKVEEIGVEAFIENVLPTAKSLKILFEQQHLTNLVTLTGPQDAEAKNLFKWDNSFGWSYTGGLADSVKERVKARGGNVDSHMRISLGWYNLDDLDLHLVGNGQHVYYAAKHSEKLNATLDIDMNASSFASSRSAVENIYITRQLPQGDYQVRVVQFNARESKGKGFTLEIEIGGELTTYSSTQSPTSRAVPTNVDFSVTSSGAVIFKENKLAKTALGVTKWGMKTGTWKQVSAVTLSPNHWTRPEGHKHLFFLLEGCISDEATRPFLNEHLCADLREDRKTMEMLGSKLEVALADGPELSGVGFSSDQRNYAFVEVEGKFKRVLKVLF